ncbi:hypothetical protein LAY57_24600 [Argonema antarcticum A004/B2]|nr:hypothetical protein [Argonema antarcticum A004/B2]
MSEVVLRSLKALTANTQSIVPKKVPRMTVLRSSAIAPHPLDRCDRVTCLANFIEFTLQLG